MRVTFFLSIFVILSNFAAKAQCKEYIKAIAPSILAPYILDGNFFAPIVYEGDKIVLHRTFLEGKKYKIAVIGMNLFEKKIKITDQDGFVLFANYQLNKKQKPLFYTNINGEKIPAWGSNQWEFSLNKTQNLKITVKLERKAKRRKNRLKGCLGIVVGFKD
jgi:hypothetical protein